MILSDPTSQVLSFFADKNPTSCVNILLVFRSYRVIRVSAHAHGFCPGAQVQPEAPYFESSAPIFPSAHEISLAQGLFIAKLSQSPNLSKAWDELVLVSIAPATHPPTPICELFNLQVQAFALVW